MVRAILEKGIALQQTGDHAAAEKIFRQVLERDPEHPDALHMLGLTLHGQGRFAEAAPAIDKAITVLPNQAMFHTHAGVVAAALGTLDPAVEHYKMAIKCDPDYADAYNNFGVLLDAIGMYDQALQILNQGLSRNSNAAMLFANRGKVLMRLGRDVDAQRNYEKALEINPSLAEVHNNLGNLLKHQGQYSRAIESFGHAIALRPDNMEAIYNKALTMAAAGGVEEADKTLEAAIYERPDPRFFIARAGLMPVIPKSIADIAAWRQRFEEGFGVLIEKGVALPGDPLEVSVMNFYLAYHGENDRRVMENQATFWQKACPSLCFNAAHCEQRPELGNNKRRVGLFSRYLRNHAVAFTVEGLVAGLNDDEFELVLITLSGGEDDVWDSLTGKAHTVLSLPHDLTIARQKIESAQLDILIYADIGMDPFSYFMAYARLAPVQCVLWGHPVTSGLPQMDYYLSNESAEPDDAEKHYTETLIRLGGVPTCYRRPSAGERVCRSKFGIPEDANVYLCPQSLFKIHPDMDLALVKILQGDPAGYLVIFHGSAQIWTDKLIQRWVPLFGEAMRRIVVLERVGWQEFLNIMSLADIMLDTWPFGGGNTNYQGFSAGLPIVTLPGKFLRGRAAMALYRHMKIDDCIANSPEEYVEIANRLGRDIGFRTAVSEKILERCPLIFDNQSVLDDLADFLKSVPLSELPNDAL